MPPPSSPPPAPKAPPPVPTPVPPLSALDALRTGAPYRAADPALVALREKARRLTREYATLPEHDRLGRIRILASLFGALGQDPEVEAPFDCEYGLHVAVGDAFAAGPGCRIIDAGPVTVGHRVRLGPGVHVYAVTRPLDPVQRAARIEQGAPVVLGDDAWIGGGSIVTPGVEIGAGTVVEVGSVVLDSLPEGVYAAGNPCRVVEKL